LIDLDLLLDIAKRDLLDLWMAKTLVVMLVLMPLLFIGMFGYMYPPSPSPNPNTNNLGSVYPNLPVCLVVMDNGQMANNFASQFIQISTEQKLFTVNEAASFQEARNMLVEGKLKGIVVFPQGFSAALASKTQATVQVTVDQSNPTIASIVQSEIAGVFNIIDSEMSARNINAVDGGQGDSAFLIQPVSIINEPLISGAASSFQFLAPGFVALTVVTGSLIGVATSISKEKEQGTMDGLLVAPVSNISIIAGKVLAQTVRGMIQGFITLVLAILVFGVRIYGSPIVMVIVMFLGTASFVGIGIVLSAIAPDQETANVMASLLQFPMMFLCGIMFPIEQLPAWMQVIGKALPLYYAADALRKVVILNASLNLIMPDILTLIAYAAATMVLALPLFDKAMRK
jgi:ABC-2 type transport system permease protein